MNTLLLAIHSNSLHMVTPYMLVYIFGLKGKMCHRCHGPAYHIYVHACVMYTTHHYILSQTIFSSMSSVTTVSTSPSFVHLMSTSTMLRYSVNYCVSATSQDLQLGAVVSQRPQCHHDIWWLSDEVLSASRKLTG